MKRLVILILAVICLLTPCFSQKKGKANQLQLIQLPKPKLTGKVSLERVLASRRSVREFSDESLSDIELSQLAWSAQGITDAIAGYRTAPSAGAIYPITIFFATPDGLFSYDPKAHSLQQVNRDDVRIGLAEAAENQEFISTAGCSIIITGNVRKIAAKYGKYKSRDFMMLEAGHIAQNILLQAVALDLGAVPVGAFKVISVRRSCKMSKEFEPLYIISVGRLVNPDAVLKDDYIREKAIPVIPSKVVKSKKALLIIAKARFRDEELFETKEVLEKAGIETTIACSKVGTITGMLGGTAETQVRLNNVDVRDYDAVVFVGGTGAREYFNDPYAHEIAKQAKKQKKVLAAICIAPTILANAELLDGIKVTAFPSEKRILKKAGAKFTGSYVERDGLIITGSGPLAATKFGQEIAKALKEQ